MSQRMSKKTHKKPIIAWAERRAHTRDRLIAAAREIIGEKGFHRATLDEIAGRANLTKGAIYDNFASKDELFLAVASAWAAARSDRFNWPVGHDGTLKARLRKFAQAVIADAPKAQLEAPLRAEFLLYTLTNEDIRKGVAKAAAIRLRSVRERTLQFLREDELPLPLDQFVVMLEALIPGLIFIRSQDNTLVPDDLIISIFESMDKSGR
jgi:AcrR family transcriptional regulator